MLGENETKTGKKTMESFRVAKVRNLWCGNGSDGDKTRSKRNGSRNGGRRALGLRKTNERENAEIRRRKPGEALQDGGKVMVIGKMKRRPVIFKTPKATLPKRKAKSEWVAVGM